MWNDQRIVLSDELGTVKHLKVKKLFAERQMKKPHGTERRKADLLTRHKSKSQKFCWPSWDEEIEFPSCHITAMSWLVPQP